MNEVGQVSSLGTELAGTRAGVSTATATVGTSNPGYAQRHSGAPGSFGGASSGASVGVAERTRADEERRFGPYSFVRALEPGRLGERWLALHDRDLSSHIVHRIVLRHDNHSRRKFLLGVQPLAELSHPHLLSVEQYSMDVSGRGCIVTPYTGSSDGLLTLAGLLQLKGGRLSASEARRATAHLLEAAAHAHERGQAHGHLTMDQILVDRHGRIQIELYGMERALGARITSTDDLIRGEVWSIIAIAYRMVTGQRADQPGTPMALGAGMPKVTDGTAKCKLDLAWESFFTKGLDEIEGYSTAADALAALPSDHGAEPAEPNLPPLRSLLSRLVEKVRRPVLE